MIDISQTSMIAALAAGIISQSVIR